MIIPYYENDGRQNFTDAFLLSLWDVIKSKGRPLCRELGTPEFFVEEMKRCSIMVLARPDRGPDGFVYFTAKNPSCFEGHFQLFVHGQEAIDCGKRFLHDVFEMVDTLQTIIGYVPIGNKQACRYSEAIGGRFVATIPGKCWVDGKSQDANLYYWRRP